MRRILLLLLIGSLCTATLTAQISINQRGKASQELKTDGITLAHPSLPINSVVRLTNTKTGKEVDATVVDRIPASPNRIADLSVGAWQQLGLDSDSDIRISSIPVVRQRISSAPAPAPAPAPAAPPPAPAVAQAAPPPPPPPQPQLPPPQPRQAAAEPAPQPAAAQAAPSKGVRYDGGGITINNIVSFAPSAPAYQAPPPPPPPAPPPPAPRYVPDADLIVRLAAVSALSQQYTPPKAPAPPPPPPPAPVVHETNNYQVLVVPVYQTQVYEQAPAAPIYYAQPMAVPPPAASPPAYAQLRVYPGFPDPNAGMTYCLQVASVAAPGSADRIAYLVRNAGFNTVQEQYGAYYRVLVPNVPAAMVYPAIQRIGATGLVEEIWVR